MRAIEAIYKFGNLYDKATKKRLLIEDGAQIAIVIDPTMLLEQDPNIEPKRPLHDFEKKLEMEAFAHKSGSTRYWRLYQTGQKFMFTISAGVRRKNQIDRIEFTFQLCLLEDLYIYNKKDKPEYARFFECDCIVEKSLNDFEFFEPVYAKSLNDAYTKTYELYFAMFGKSTANAFDRIYISDPKYPIRSRAEEIQKQKPDNINY